MPPQTSNPKLESSGHRTKRSISHSSCGLPEVPWALQMQRKACNRVSMAWGWLGLRMGTPTLCLAWRKTCTTFICFVSLFNREYSCFGFPRWLSGKESLRQCRTCRFDPWVWKIPWRRKWQPAPVFLCGKSHGQRSLAGYSPRGHRETDLTECAHRRMHSCFKMLCWFWLYSELNQL